MQRLSPTRPYWHHHGDSLYEVFAAEAPYIRLRCHSPTTNTDRQCLSSSLYVCFKATTVPRTRASTCLPFTRYSPKACALPRVYQERRLRRVTLHHGLHLPAQGHSAEEAAASSKHELAPCRTQQDVENVADIMFEYQHGWTRLAPVTTGSAGQTRRTRLHLIPARLQRYSTPSGR
jgi:hypothetical protein